MKSTRVVFCLYTPAMVIFIENWLTKKTKNGWRLINKKGFLFYFVKCSPYESRYFMYQSFDASKGFSVEYLRAKEKYAKTKTQLNKTQSTVFEVDFNKIDHLFEEYVKLRSKFYRKHYFWLTVVSGISLLLSAMVLAVEGNAYFITLSWLLVFLYAAVSFWQLKRDAG